MTIISKRAVATASWLFAAVAISSCASAPIVSARAQCPPPTVAARITTQGTELTALTPPPVPERAERLEHSGQATLSCLPVGGRLKACEVMFEAPARMGIARTALTHAPKVIYPGADRPERVVVTFRYDLIQAAGGAVCS